MLVTMFKPVEVEIKYLKVQVPNEYDESGFSDEGYEKYCKSLSEDKEYWCPLIDIDNGHIVNWVEGLSCDIFFKPVDEGVYTFLGENNVEHLKHEGYVPNFLGINSQSYGDYIDLSVNSEGYIIGWNKDDVLDYITNYDED